MGMFDRLFDSAGLEWQTKALGRSLDAWHIGDSVPVPFDCQIEVIGGRHHQGIWSRATVRDGVLVAVPAHRDRSLPLIPYGGLGAAYATDPEPSDSDPGHPEEGK